MQVISIVNKHKKTLVFLYIHFSIIYVNVEGIS